MQTLEIQKPNEYSFRRSIRDAEGLIARLGVEIGSLSTFYSMERPTLGKLLALQINEEMPSGSELGYLNACFKMADADIAAKEWLEIQPNMGHRVLEVKAMDMSYLMDAVLRFVFPLARVKEVSIGSKVIPWQRRNRYHQFLAEPATVQLRNGRRFTFHSVTHEAPEGMALNVYFRDEPDAWVFHVRMLAIRPTHFAVRGCTRWFNRPLPSIVQQVARRIPGFLERTLFIRERISQRIPFQTNGAVLLQPGQTIRFAVDWEIEG